MRQHVINCSFYLIRRTIHMSKKNKDLSGEDKVRKYENLKKEKYGDYYDAMVGREDRYQNYQTELNLMNNDSYANIYI